MSFFSWLFPTETWEAIHNTPASCVIEVLDRKVEKPGVVVLQQCRETGERRMYFADASGERQFLTLKCAAHLLQLQMLQPQMATWPFASIPPPAPNPAPPETESQDP